MQFRMSLLPYLYSLVRESHLTCLPMCRSNCIEQPDWEEGYAIWDAYFLGDRLYAAPMVGPRTIRQVLLPPGTWYHGLTGERLHSDGRTYRTQVAPFNAEPLHYYRAGSLMVKQPYLAISTPQLAEILPQGPGFCMVQSEIGDVTWPSRRVVR